MTAENPDPAQAEAATPEQVTQLAGRFRDYLRNIPQAPGRYQGYESFRTVAHDQDLSVLPEAARSKLAADDQKVVVALDYMGDAKLVTVGFAPDVAEDFNPLSADSASQYWETPLVMYILPTDESSDSPRASMKQGAEFERWQMTSAEVAQLGVMLDSLSS